MTPKPQPTMQPDPLGKVCDAATFQFPAHWRCPVCGAHLETLRKVGESLSEAERRLDSEHECKFNPEPQTPKCTE